MDSEDGDYSSSNWDNNGKPSPLRPHQAYRLKWLVFCVGLSLVGSFGLRKVMTTTAVVRHKLKHVEDIDPEDLKRTSPLLSSSGALLYHELAARLEPPAVVPLTEYETTTAQYNKPQLVTHALCPGCRTATVTVGDNTITCGSLMYQLTQKKKSKSLVEAGINIASRFEKDCGSCHPESCNDAQKVYWPMDVAAPPILRSRSPRLRIPDEYRVPETALDDLESYFAEKKHQHPHLFEWNPSIIVLPDDQIPERHRQNLDTADRPVYLATFRLSKQQNCFRQDEPFLKYLGTDSRKYKADFVDLVGMAFLREDLSILEQAFFDVRRVLHRDQDVRLFVFPPNGERESRIYLSAFHEVTRLWLTLPDNKQDKRIFYDYFEESANPFAIITEEHARCCLHCHGKNFNYFQDATTGDVKVETLPMKPHVVEDMDFTKPCTRAQDAESETAPITKDFFVPKPSFSNTDEVYFFDNGVTRLPYGPDHGTACCVKLPDPRQPGKHLLVGVSHTKTIVKPHEKAKLRESGIETEDRQYISSFYAFEPIAPYRVVSRTGSFCMPFPKEDEAAENYHTSLVTKRPYRLGKKPLQCPYITFVSGISEVAGDDSKVLLAYGMNDCVSRFSVIAKDDIRRMLFEPNSGVTVGEEEEEEG